MTPPELTIHAERFAGVERLYGQGSVDALAGKHVCVIGVGGVGSWAAEALARSGWAGWVPGRPRRWRAAAWAGSP